jgi:RecA-family ATPase
MQTDFEPVRFIAPILPEGCIILGGSPKVGKSWFCLDLCLCVNSMGSRQLFRHYDVEPCESLYLALEDSPNRMKDRLKTLISPPLQFHLHMKAPKGMRMALEWPRLDQGCIDALDEHIKKHPMTRLIIIDTLQKIRPASNRGVNVYEQDYSIISSLQRFAISRHITMLLVTHLKKDNGLSGSDPFDQVTGSMGISGAADATIILKRSAESKDAKLYTRGRDIEDQAIMLKFNDGFWTYTGGGDAGNIEHAQEIIDCLAENNRPMTAAEISKWLSGNDSIKLSHPRRTMSALTDRGCVRKSDGKYFL